MMRLERCLLLLGLWVFQPPLQVIAQAPPAASHQEQSQATFRSGFVGDESCNACHRVEGATYAHTAHHLTSQLPDEKSILGSFLEGANLLKISDPAPVIGDPGLSYKMERRQDGYFVTAITELDGQKQSRSERMDLVIGSGTRGQSYLYWRGDALFELPVSYWSDGRQWINSPGYRNGPPVFDRPASPRCLECHITYIEQLVSDPMRTGITGRAWLLASAARCAMDLEPATSPSTKHAPVLCRMTRLSILRGFLAIDKSMCARSATMESCTPST
jgi:hypothetical protein